MTTTSSLPGLGRDRLRSTARAAIVVLALAAIVLAFLVVGALRGGPARRADVGEQVPLQVQPYGLPLTFQLPGSEVTVEVGDPVGSLAHDLLDIDYDDDRYGSRRNHDLAAPVGGSLVPITWQTRSTVGFGGPDDTTPIEIRLVAGDQRVDLDSVALDGASASLDAYDATSVAVAVGRRVDVDDLAVEVEYAGLTQTGDVASGAVDAGVAQALYDDDRDFTAGCLDYRDDCSFRAVDPDSPRRPSDDGLSTSYLTLYPYDARLGWAPAGSLWAGVRLQLFGADGVEDAAGRTWTVARQSAPAVTLDGARPVRREGLPASGFDSTGRVVFRVDTDAVPRELDVRVVVSLAGRAAPDDLPVQARMRLSAVG